MFTMPSVFPQSARVSDYGSGCVYSVSSGTNVNCYTEADRFMASPPAGLATTIFTGPITLNARFLGIHCTSSTPTGVPLVTADGHPSNLIVGTARSWDVAPKWRDQHTADGVFVDAGLSKWLTEMKTAGAETIFTIFHTPQWASARPSETGDPYGHNGALAEPADMTKLAAYVTWLMTNYGSQIDYLEIGNEAKYSVGGNSFFSGTASKLAEMARTVNLAAKAVKPSIPILGCGGFPPGVGTYTADFLAASDNHGGHGSDWIDILTIHTYTGDINGYNDPKSVAGFATTVPTMLTAAGISGKPYWSTEWGFGNPLFAQYGGSAVGRVRFLMRAAMYHAIGGFARNVYYSTTFGPLSGSEFAEWNRCAAIINGGVLQRINRFGTDGRLYCAFAGANLVL